MRKGGKMNPKQAVEVMEQAVLLAVRGCNNIKDMKMVLVAWDTVKPLIKTEDEHHES